MALQCAATLLVARHGEDVDARLFQPVPGRLTDRGVAQVQALTRSLGQRRLAAVYTSPLPPAVESGVVAGWVLGMTPLPVTGLEEVAAVEPAESGEAVLARFYSALLGIADLHRGETVLVFSHGAVMAHCLPRLASRHVALAGHGVVPHCTVAEVAVDQDGLEVLGWPAASESAVSESAVSESAAENG